MQAHWSENASACYGDPEIRKLLGGLAGYTKYIGMWRYHPIFCKPGLWNVDITCGSEVAEFLGIEVSRADAVQDDFGNLVRVPS